MRNNPSQQFSRPQWRGFTLTEVLVAMTLFGIVITIALSGFLAALRHSRFIEDSNQTANAIRYASDLISQTVRSAAINPQVSNSGRILRVAPNEPYFVTVEGTATVDPLTSPPILGCAAGQRVITISSLARQPATVWALTNVCPDTAISSTSSGFVTAADLPTISLADFFEVGDQISLPGTRYGAPANYTIQSINDGSSKSITVNANLAHPIPNGTKFAASSGRYIRFSIEDNGDLRYYPDDRNLTRFAVIARNIHTAPRIDPFNETAGTEAPFSFDAAERIVTIHLQCLPAGNAAGRTTLSSRTAAHVRTNPLSM